MKIIKEMPAPWKDEQTQNNHSKNSKLSPLSQVDNWQPIGAVVARLLAKQCHRQLISNPTGGSHAERV